MSYMLEELQRRLNSLTDERKKQIECLANSTTIDPRKIREMTEPERRYYISIRNRLQEESDNVSYDIRYDME